SSMSSKLFASDGSQVATLHGEINRDPVPLSRIPRQLQEAAIAIEDRRFYQHGAVDIRGTARALLHNISSGEQQGGSTITQQLAKNLYFHGRPRTIWRKGAEAILAVGLERVSSKDQILQAYLNTAYFGRGAYGVQTAARSYFRKDVSKLTLAESAFLAGLIHTPARYDFTTTDAPDVQRSRKVAATDRRNVVLDAMAAARRISREEAARAKAEPVDIEPPRDPRWKHPYFVDAVLRELGVLRNRGDAAPDPRFDVLGTTHADRADAVYRKGLRITTTLDRDIQENAEDAISEQLPEGVLPKLSAALVSVQPGTGAVRALVGGRDYYPKGCDDVSDASSQPAACRHAKVNLALGSLAGGSGRQPGSSFKPIVLAAALEEGLSLRQQLDGSPFTYHYGEQAEWKVANYENSAGGTMDVIDATVRSVNAAYARLEIQFLGDGVGTKGSAKVARVARKLGISLPTSDELKDRCGESYNRNGGCTPADNVPAIALGAKEVSPIDMAGAYATFANDGVYARPTLIAKITDADGKVIYRAEPDTHRAVSSETARGVSHVLQQVVQRGTGRSAALDRAVAGKTGTSQEWRDAWFDGYIPQLATVTWVGNPVPVQSGGRWTVESMTPSNGYPTRIVGGSFPARIWHAAMQPSVDKLDVRDFPDAPSSLFGPSKALKKFKGEEKDAPEISDLAGLIRLERSGRRVVVHRGCPPNGSGGNGIHVWKQEERGGETHVWRSRAVC
ncbi:MAG TPA: transglycosylase domain-containing protein, partial [Candidatus Limnocylindria bacterium]|nr:transglycosylase domain-containing protein [Candidatus Limnocylindria bacterium]